MRRIPRRQHVHLSAWPTDADGMFAGRGSAHVAPTLADRLSRDSDAPKHSATRLLVAQRIDRIEACGSSGGEKPEHDADSSGKQQRQ